MPRKALKEQFIPRIGVALTGYALGVCFKPWKRQSSTRTVKLRGSPMNTIKLTRENLHQLSASPGKAGFTRKQIEALGFEWPASKGWLTSLIGKEISQENYDVVKSLGHPKWEMKQQQGINLGKDYWSAMVPVRQYEELKHMLKNDVSALSVGNRVVLTMKKNSA